MARFCCKADLTVHLENSWQISSAVSLSKKWHKS